MKFERHRIYKWVFFVWYFTLATAVSKGQETGEEEQRIENLAGQRETDEFESDAIDHPLRSPTIAFIKLNTVTIFQLLATGMVSRDQASQFIAYRKLMGPFISIYELQAVPGWDLETLHRLKPLLVKSQWELGRGAVEESKIKQLLVIRAARTLELSRGYRERDSLGATHYLGSPNQLSIRYHIKMGEVVQAGFTAEKDAGELFGKGAQKTGFDFYSYYILWCGGGLLRNVLVGDYTVNLGQGLLLWQSLAFSKTSDLGLVFRQSPVLRAYQSSGETIFQRGIATQLAMGAFEVNLFMARNRMDANLEMGTNGEWKVTSIIETGYHRSMAENEDRHRLRESVAGASLAIKKRSWHVALNGIAYQFNYPLEKQALPYNMYAIRGDHWLNAGLDYDFNFRNGHYFGELAFDRRGNKAFVTGAQLSVDPNVDLGWVFRHLGGKYRAMDGNAFTESAEPSNENGLWLGLNIRSGKAWKWSAYADLFSFPWLKYRIDGISGGKEFLLRCDYQRGHTLALGSTLRWENKPAADSMVNSLRPVTEMRRFSWRNQFDFVFSTRLRVRSRVEMVEIGKKEGLKSTGFLTNLDIFYGFKRPRLSVNSRVEWFDTDGYDSRIYTFENDVPYHYSVPAMFNSGFRYYLNVKISYDLKFTAGLKWAQTMYMGGTAIGSGWNEISGRKRSDLRIELLIKF